MTQDELNNNLLFAAKAGKLKKVTTLISQGANVNAVLGESGKTPLYLAIENDKTEVALLLIENGADLKLADKDNWGPLQIAACKANSEVFEALINKGVTEENPDLDPRKIALIGYITEHPIIPMGDKYSLNENFEKINEVIDKGKVDAPLSLDFYKYILETIKKNAAQLNDNGRKVEQFLENQLKYSHDAVFGLQNEGSATSTAGMETTMDIDTQNAGSTNSTTEMEDLMNKLRIGKDNGEQNARSLTMEKNILKALLMMDNLLPATSAGKRQSEGQEEGATRGSKKNTGLGGVKNDSPSI